MYKRQEYNHAKECIGVGELASNRKDLASHFRSLLEADDDIDTSNPVELLEYLSRSMAMLSSLDPSISPSGQHASLISGDLTQRTLRLCRKTSREALSPPEVTKVCKSLGSGKLGRVYIGHDGSAVFDLPSKRAEKLLDSFRDASTEFELEMPLTLPFDM